MEHETVTLMYRNRPIEIDRGIAELIKVVWARGWDTDGCCECDEALVEHGLSEKAMAYIGFDNRIDAVRFLLDTAGPDLAMELQTFSSPEPNPTVQLRNGWSVMFLVSDQSYMVNFPPELIPELTEKLKCSSLTKTHYQSFNQWLTIII